jgi:hypothetical protein
LERNPDDTIVLSIGGGPATSTVSNTGEKRTWEIGRSARRVEGVWDHVLNVISSTSQPEVAEESEATRFENQLDAAGMLSEMCRSYLDRLPQIPPALNPSSPELRPDVLKMFTHYIEGVGFYIQPYSKLTFTDFRSARHLGVDLKFRGGEGE